MRTSNTPLNYSLIKPDLNTLQYNVKTIKINRLGMPYLLLFMYTHIIGFARLIINCWRMNKLFGLWVINFIDICSRLSINGILPVEQICVRWYIVISQCMNNAVMFGLSFGRHFQSNHVKTLEAGLNFSDHSLFIL